MIITLTPDQEASLSALVAAGDFSFRRGGGAALPDERLAEREIEEDDFAWAKPFIDEAVYDTH